jgi:hypothetical protein
MRFFSNDARENDEDTARIPPPEQVAAQGRRSPSPWATPDDHTPGSVATPSETNTTTYAASTADTDPDTTAPLPRTGSHDDARDGSDISGLSGAERSDVGRSDGDRSDVERPDADRSDVDRADADRADADLSDADRDEIVDVPLDDDFDNPGSTASGTRPDGTPVSRADAPVVEDSQAAFGSAHVDDPDVVDGSDLRASRADGSDLSDLRDDEPGFEGSRGDGSRAGEPGFEGSTVEGSRDSDVEEDAVGGTLKDDGGFEDPKAVDPSTEKPLDDSRDSLDSRGDEAADDSAAPAEPAVPVDGEPVIPAEGEPIVATTGEPATSANGEPALAPIIATPLPSQTAAKAPENAEPFFAEADTQTFKERWRDVQLRFVDSPKDAAAEAATLVDEAVEKLTASIASHKDTLAGDHEDTEALRVQLRGYRDILNRVLGL